MKLSELKGSYDAVFSLGSSCIAAIQLQRNGLRPYSGVLDWMLSESLTHVNMLLHNRFAGFMESSRLVYEPYQDKLVLKDSVYQIKLLNDLPLDSNGIHILSAMPDCKIKIDRRAERMLRRISTCRSILFVRLGGSFQEAAALQNVLSAMLPGDFRVLLVNDSPHDGITECNWPLDRICAIHMPLHDDCNDLWKDIFDGVTLTGNP